MEHLRGQNAMTKGRDMMAESVEDVLKLVRSRRQSGLLSIEHTQGSMLEEGEIYFQSGQPVYARVGRIVGQDALTWLSRWHPINFAFITNVPRPPASLQIAETAVSRFATSTPGAAAPAQGYPRFDSNEPPGVWSRQNGNARSNPEPVTATTSTPGIEWLIPQKRGNEREVLAMPLTRRQRFIYFLVDGRRTVADLARCTGKSIQEVERTLGELQEQGLIAV
jgi:Domain of unknown function (DUF4388)